MKQAPKLVIIEDNTQHFQLMAGAIKQKWPEAQIHQLPDATGLLEQVSHLCPDIIVTEYRLSGKNGLEVLEVLNPKGSGIPVIMVTGQGSEQVAVRAMKLGARDYLVKTPEFFSHLPAVVEQAVCQRHSAQSPAMSGSCFQAASEEKYRMVVDNANEAINIAQDGFLRFVNPKSVEMLGRSRQELLDRPFVCFIHPQDRDMVMDRHRDRMLGNVPPNRYAFRIIDGQKQTRWVEMNVVPFTWNSRPATLNFLNDITERKLAKDRVHRLSQQLIQAHEMERKKLSLDLHDHLAQDLSSLKMRLDTLCGTGTGLPPEIGQQLSGLSSLARRTIMAVREMAYDLRPASLDQLGLVQTLAQHCEDFSARNDLAVDFFSAGMEAVSSDFDTDITIYRLVQEALNNIGKHARATRVAVKIVASFPEIIVRIEDNGLGFDVKNRREAALHGRHMGIWSMEQRVAMINGSLKIDSIPHQGTKIVVKIPFKEAGVAEEKNHNDRG